MKAAIIFLSGLVAVITGALIRSCNADIYAELARNWCGSPSTNMFLGSHAHCAGCELLATGFVAMLGAIVFANALPRRSVAERI